MEASVDFINKISPQLQSNIPMLAISGKLDLKSIMLSFLPIIISTLADFLIKFIKKYSKKSTMVFYKSKENLFFDKLTKFITLNCKEKERCNYYSTNSKLEDNLHKPEFVIYEPVKYFLINGECININLEFSEKETKYTLTSNSKKNLDDFLKIVNDFQLIENSSFIAEISKSSRYESPFFNFRKITIQKNFNNVFLKEKDLSLIINSLNEFISSKENYKKLGIPYKKGFILYGLPGTGKTALTYAIASFLNRNIYKFNISEDITNSEFLNLITSIASGSIVLFEDADVLSFFTHRKIVNIEDKRYLSERELNKLSLDTILNVFDGYSYLEDCILIVTTNYIEKIDDAIIRPGRIDHLIEFNACDLFQINNILKYFYGADKILNKKLKNKLLKSNITSGKLINTYILPNLNNTSNFIKLIENLSEI